MVVKFTVDGPHAIERTQRPGGSIITRENITNFWYQHEDLAEERGCYVFGVRNGRGILPGYVGKASTGFAREVFQNHKLNCYYQYLAHTRKGTPVLFFVVAPRSRGKPNISAIEKCESELITLAVRTNPNLTNVRGTRGPSFVIPHVTEPTRGRPSDPARALCATLGLPVAEARTESRVDRVRHIPSDEGFQPIAEQLVGSLEGDEFHLLQQK